MYDERTGETHYIRDNEGLVSESMILAPDGVPDKLLVRESLWNNVEASEKRKDAVFAFEFDAALPLELSYDEQVALMIDFCNDYFVSRGIICDANMHNKEDNPHFHCMMTTRPVDASTETGFDKKKAREWFKIGTIQEEREAYSAALNKHLEKAGSEIRYTEKSFEDRGIDQIPQVHIGPTAAAMQKKHEAEPALYPMPERVIQNNNIISLNAKRAEKKAAEEASKVAKESKARSEEKAAKAIASRMSAMPPVVRIGTPEAYYKDYTAAHDLLTEAWIARAQMFEIIRQRDADITADKESAYHKAKAGIYDIIKDSLKTIRNLSFEYILMFRGDLHADAVDYNSKKTDIISGISDP